MRVINCVLFSHNFLIEVTLKPLLIIFFCCGSWNRTNTSIFCLKVMGLACYRYTTPRYLKTKLKDIKKSNFKDKCGIRTHDFKYQKLTY